MAIVCVFVSNRVVVKIICDDGEFYAGVITTINQFVTPPFHTAEAFAHYAAEHSSVEQDEKNWLEMARNPMVVELRSADILHLCTLIGELKRGIKLGTVDCLALYQLNEFLQFTVEDHRKALPEIDETAGNRKIDQLGMRGFFPGDWDWCDILEHANGVGYYNACARVMYPEHPHDRDERCPELSRQLCGWYFAERMKLAGIAGEGKRSPIEAMRFFFEKYMMQDQG